MPSRPPKTPGATGKDSDAQALALYKAAWAEALPDHEKRCRRYDEQERAFHAELKPQDDVGYHNLAPAYAFEVIELLGSNLVDDHPRPKVTPKRAGAEQAAKLLQDVLIQHREEDARGEKLPIWVKRALVHNISPAKMSWLYEERTVKRRNFTIDPFSQGGYIEGEPREDREICSRPTLTLIDPRDFLWQPGAKTIDESAYILARFFETTETLKRQAKQGDYGIYKNLDKLAQPASDSRSARKGKRQHTIVEFWTPERLITVADHQIVIRDDPNPDWRLRLPFVGMVLIPDLRTLEGISIVEMIEPLQTALWRSLNQRLDMGEIVLNPPIIEDETQDPTKPPPKFVPGARYRAQHTDAIKFIETPVGILAAAIENASTLRSDMRDISGAVPALSGAADETLDQKTATGISIIQSVAQQRLKRMRTQAGVAEKRCGTLELAMEQQLGAAGALRQSQPDGQYAFKPYTPADLQGDVEFDIDDVNESLDQQRRRDEATLRIQMGLAVNAAQPGLVNLEAEYTNYLEAFDEEHPEKFLNQHPQVPGMQVQASGVGGGMPMAPPPQGPPSDGGGMGGPPIAPPGMAPVAGHPALAAA